MCLLEEVQEMIYYATHIHTKFLRLRQFASVMQ